MDGDNKTRIKQEQLIPCDTENKLYKKTKERSKKRNASPDKCQSSDVIGAEKSFKAALTKRRKTGSTERKHRDGSLTSCAAVEGKAHCEEQEEESPSPSNANNVEVTSSSSALTASKTKESKSESRKDARKSDFVFSVNITAKYVTTGGEEQSKRNRRKKKSKRDKHVVFTSPFLFDDLLDNQQTRDRRTEACVDVTNQTGNLEARSLNCKRENAGREVAGSSVSEICDDLQKRKEEDSVENGRKSIKKKEGKNGKEVKSESAVDVLKSSEKIPRETVMKSLDGQPRHEESGHVQNSRKSRKRKEGRNRNEVESESAVNVPISSEEIPRETVMVSLVDQPQREEAGPVENSRKSRKRKEGRNRMEVESESAVKVPISSEEIPRETVMVSLVDQPQCKAAGLVENSRKSRKRKEGRNGKEVENEPAVNVLLSDVEKTTEMVMESLEEIPRETVMESLDDQPKREEAGPVENSRKSRKRKEGRNRMEVESESAVNVQISSEEIPRETVMESLDDQPKPEEAGLVENSRKSRKKKEGRNRMEVESDSAVNVLLSDVEKPTKMAKENQMRRTNGTEVECLTKDSESSAHSLTNNDKPLAEQQHKTKRKTTTGGDCIAILLLSKGPQDNSPMQLRNNPTETGGGGDGTSESPKKNGKLSSGAAVKEGIDPATGLFWLKPAASGAGIPRPNKNLFRRKMRCPVGGCLGRSTRINRHILDCHPELESSEREKLVADIMANPCDYLGAVPAARVVPILKRKMRCPVKGCFGETTRLRRHLIACHSELTPAQRDELWEKVSQNPMEYLCSSTSVEQEGTEVTRRRSMTAGIPRPNVKVHTRRRKQICIVAGCLGAPVNMRRHLEDCHADIAGKHEELLVKLIERRQRERAAAKEELKYGRRYRKVSSRGVLSRM